MIAMFEYTKPKAMSRHKISMGHISIESLYK